MESLSLGEAIPAPPNVSQEDLQCCRDSGDYRPILFEWYKFVGLICDTLGSISIESPALRKEIRRRDYYVLIGLLNRCARLMLANVALSHEARFGETTAIIDRCVFESCLKIIWLCNGRSEEKFDRYLADGLKADLELKRLIQAEISSGKQGATVIQNRILRSISNCVDASGLSEDKVDSQKKMPDIASIMEGLDMGRMIYVMAHRMGSHHIHGTWTSLLMHYLEEDGKGGFRPRDHDCETDVNQFAFIPLSLVGALREFVFYVVEEDEEAAPILDLLTVTEEEILKLLRETAGSDFEVDSAKLLR